MEFREKLRAAWIAAVFGGIALILIFVKAPIDPFFSAQLISIGLFLLFYRMGEAVMKFELPRRFFRYTGGISYAIFLLQHVVMGKVIGMFSQQSLTIAQEAALLIAVFMMIYLFADIATRLNRILTQSKWFTKLIH